MTTPGPIGARRRLGAELRRLRRQSGMHLDEVALRVPCSTSKISRLETGKGVPKLADVRSLIAIYEVGSDTERDMLLRLARDSREHGWWEELTDGMQPERFVMDVPGRFVALENEAVAERSFHVSMLHGLLQTPEYAREVISRYMPHHSVAEIDRLVEMRARRQDALLRSVPPPLSLDVVLDESCLARIVGSHEDMARQLDRVLTLSALPNVTIRVLTFEAGVRRAHAGTFVLLEIPAERGSDVVYIEGHAGETYLDAESDVGLYEDVFADVLSEALDPDDSSALITRYLDELAPHESRD